MRGFLTFQILWELSKSPMNGQQIAQQIAKRRGTKPTPGTIYPALKDLKDRGLIEGSKEEGDRRQVVYRLTEAGEEGFVDAARYFHQVFGDLADEAKVIVMRVGDCE